MDPYPALTSPASLPPVSTDVRRVRHKFLMDDSLQGVVKALGWIKNAPPCDVLAMASEALLGVKENLTGLGAGGA